MHIFINNPIIVISASDDLEKILKNTLKEEVYVTGVPDETLSEKQPEKVVSDMQQEKHEEEAKVQEQIPSDKNSRKKIDEDVKEQLYVERKKNNTQTGIVTLLAEKYKISTPTVYNIIREYWEREKQRKEQVEY